MKKLIICGGYGNGTVVASTVTDINKVSEQWKIIGFLNDFETEPINGFSVLGKIDKETAHHYLRDPDVYFYYSLISTRFNHKYIHKLTEKRIETLFSQLCDQFMIRRNYAKSFEGFKTRILAKISSLTPIQFLNKFVFKRPINKIKLNLS